MICQFLERGRLIGMRRIVREARIYEQFEDFHIFRKSEHFAANQQNKKKHISSYL